MLEYSKIIQLITQNEHDEALKEMLSFTSQHASQYNNVITVHQTKFDALESDNTLGVLSRDEYTRDKTKLTMAILTLLDKLKTVNLTDNGEKTIDLKPENSIPKLYDLVCRLYPKGIQDNRIWERSGGNISYFSSNHTAQEQWWDALQKLKNGGGGDITFERFNSEINKDFPNL